MASGSGKNQDDTETKEPVVLLRLREESNAAAATEPPPSAPPLEVIPEEEEVHGSQEAGGRNPSATTATAAAAEQKGEETGSLFWAVWDPAGGKPPLPPRPPSFSRAGGPSSAIDLKDVFDELMLESQRERSVETDQKAEAEGTPRQQNEQVLFPGYFDYVLARFLFACDLAFGILNSAVLGDLGGGFRILESGPKKLYCILE
jgi:ubiquitin thioesterase protein OTUB1